MRARSACIGGFREPRLFLGFDQGEGVHDSGLAAEHDLKGAADRDDVGPASEDRERHEIVGVELLAPGAAHRAGLDGAEACDRCQV
jgi:hypothetical protein